ncbi:MAG TPA: rod-binding protein [Verrucomicrobiae bacterium]|nr:rod-binding protein [Verrucomicrobiae bacterium]
MDISSVQSKVNPADVPVERLANNHALTEEQKIGEAGRQFEAILLRQILTEAQKTTIKSKYSDESTATSIYRDMTVRQLADSISRGGGLGLAKALNEELTKQLTGQ